MKNTCNGYNIRSRVQRHKITVIMKGHNILEDLKMGKRTIDAQSNISYADLVALIVMIISFSVSFVCLIGWSCLFRIYKELQKVQN